MKALLLLCFIILSGRSLAQNGQVNALPTGKYETVSSNSQSRWDRGDIILLDGNKYRMSTGGEVGDYRFSVAAQRVFFTSGPLKSLFARTAVQHDIPTIVLPVSENTQLKLASDVWGVYRQ